MALQSFLHQAVGVGAEGLEVLAPLFAGLQAVLAVHPAEAFENPTTQQLLHAFEELLGVEHLEGEQGDAFRALLLPHVVVDPPAIVPGEQVEVLEHRGQLLGGQVRLRADGRAVLEDHRLLAARTRELEAPVEARRVEIDEDSRQRQLRQPAALGNLRRGRHLLAFRAFGGAT